MEDKRSPARRIVRIAGWVSAAILASLLVLLVSLWCGLFRVQLFPVPIL